MSQFRLPGCASEPRNRIVVRSFVVSVLVDVSPTCLLSRRSSCYVSARLVRLGSVAQSPLRGHADG